MKIHTAHTGSSHATAGNPSAAMPFRRDVAHMSPSGARGGNRLAAPAPQGRNPGAPPDGDMCAASRLRRTYTKVRRLNRATSRAPVSA